MPSEFRNEPSFAVVIRIVASTLVATLALVALIDMFASVFSSHFSGATVSLITDESTGCEYIIPHAPWRSGITPRLDSSGKPICRAPKSKPVE